MGRQRNSISFVTFAAGVVLSGGLLLAPGVGAADLVEPWAPGVSNAELFLSRSDAPDSGSTAGLVGLGLGAYKGNFVSFGLSHASPQGEPASSGLVLVLTRPLGRFGEVDLWGELLRLDGGGGEPALAERGIGLEWSASVGEAGWLRPVPYLRLTAARCEGETTIQPLAGLLLPLRGPVGLHLELAAEAPESGRWPVSLALGPNWQVTEWLEVLPELAVVYEGGEDGEAGTSLGFTVGAVMDLTALPFVRAGGVKAAR